jgi:pimeloyl-ACP methyl ester carboxylesterase
VPVLVLDGDRDEDVTIEHTRDMAELIPGAELKLMCGVGSDAPTQDPEAFTASIQVDGRC